MSTHHEIVKSVSLDNLLNQRNAVIEKLGAALALLREADLLAAAGHLGFPDFAVDRRFGRDCSLRLSGTYREPLDDLMATATRWVDAEGWGYLMDESGLRTFMDSETRREWSSKVHKMEVPALTAENVQATFQALHDARSVMFDQGVINCFRKLSWDYKTNLPFKFGKRIVMRSLCSSYGVRGSRWLSLNVGRAEALDDLDRVFHVLDGKPEPDHRQGWCARLSHLMSRGPGSAEGPYFQAKWFLNGNAHVCFTRPDLVQQMNRILTRHHPNALASEVRR